MDDNFLKKLFEEHQKSIHCPSSLSVYSFFNRMLGFLFAEFSNRNIDSVEELKSLGLELQDQLKKILEKCRDCLNTDHHNSVSRLWDALPGIKEKLELDIRAMYEGDPAAKSRTEVIRTYPGFYAIASYRIAHFLYHIDYKLLSRIITENAHTQTGIDIHPGARIGESFCIDHGTGIVIGETTIIGNHVKIYQGVTLGALSVEKKDAAFKRHPTIEDHTVIYAGATILGGNTIIGKHSIIGGNVWLTESVPPYSRITYVARQENQTLPN